MTPKDKSGLGWAIETMMMINKLTTDIKGKASDPDWFLLRERLEEAGCVMDAGAPELLEALCQLGQATAPFISQAIGSNNPTVMAAVNKANAAIAKAKGQT